MINKSNKPMLDRMTDEPRRTTDATILIDHGTRNVPAATKAWELSQGGSLSVEPGRQNSRTAWSMQE
jgi:hypothetical protein